MESVMRTHNVAAAYDRWAPIYDLVFGPVFRRGRAVAIDAAGRLGGRVLEVGVGTGISLPGYDHGCRLTGIDISEGILSKARSRVRRLKLDNVESIEVMDAENLAYADGSFDVVVAQYVVSAIPNPERALDEFARVLKPGGEIVITTRISAESGMRGAIEKALMPITSRLGFRTDFPWERFENWAARSGAVVLIERRPLPPLGHFALLRFRKIEEKVQ